MMKKLLYTLVAFWVFSFYSYAQEQSDHTGSVLSGATNFKDVSKNLQMQIQIGSVFQYPLNATKKTKAGFPFGVLYVPNTFNEKTFEVSKGFFPDVVKVSWSIGANEEKITKIHIFRKELAGDGAYNLIATVGKDAFEFEDTQIEGGVLYQYKVAAIDVSNIEQKYVTFIEGIGFRNPTANVSGSVSFKGGSPVKDVRVLAEAVGAEGSNLGTSMQFDDFNQGLTANLIGKEINSQQFTVQGWVSGFGTRVNHPFLVDKTPGNRLYFRIHRVDYELYIGYWEANKGHNLAVIGNEYPTGEVDAFGNDVFAPITEIKETDFLHLSFVMEDGKKPKVYLNGRPLTQEYYANANNSGYYRDHIDGSITGLYDARGGSGNLNDIARVYVGAAYVGNIDEFRLWNRTLTDQEIRRDYKRYLNGGERGLKMYLRMDEGIGNYAYDISKEGFKFNKNHAVKTSFGSTTMKFSKSKPTKEQLGVFGITDKDGAYTISAIPYAGTGEQFKITPSLGVHKFNPASQTLFLGKDEPIVNQVDFEDVSSFKFNGRVVFDTRGVFKDEAFLDPTVNDSNTILKAVNKEGKSIREVGYNQYLVDGTTTIFKGEYFYDANQGAEVTVDGNGNLIGGTLKRYPIIGVEEANLYIDGELVLDEDNQPVVTDADGKFSINVPIGRHKVEVKKQGHTFALDGRFPEKTENTDTNLFDFYEDQIQERWFIDDTRVTVVGRVVGGRIESEKEIGFGFDGLKEHANEVADGEPENKEIYSSVNNIGKATLILKGDINTNELDYVFETNAETGEYKIQLIPYIYHVRQNGGISIASNTNINGDFLDSDDTLNVTEIKQELTSSFTAQDGTEYTSDPYQYVKSFRYNSPVSLELMEQKSAETIEVEKIVNGEKVKEDYKVDHLPEAIYLQAREYEFVLEVSQDYLNYDADSNNPTRVKEYYTEGEFNITNNLAFEPSLSSRKSKGKDQWVYKFTAGDPNISHNDNFEYSINIRYELPNSTSITLTSSADVTFKNKAIVIGFGETEGSTFVTSAPQLPSIILRDPPGTQSFASITKGTSISFEKSSSNFSNSSNSKSLNVSIGADVEISTGIGVSKTTTIDVTADTGVGVSTSISRGTDGVETQTFTFEETISTSDDTDFVGALGDLYIGNATNIKYGIINSLFFNDVLPSDANVGYRTLQLVNEDNQNVDFHLYAKKANIIAEVPTNTFFTYSQKFILEELIPDLIENANVQKEKELTATQQVIPSSKYLFAQAELWKKVIQDNERSKYNALNNRGAEETRIKGIIDGLDTQNSNKEKLKNLLSQNFYKNVSIDRGVQEYVNTVSTVTVDSKSYTKTIDVDKSFAANVGIQIDGVGATASFDTNTGKSKTSVDNLTEETVTTFSYTLKDNDDNNRISVDIVNLFDGNGPIFASKGGVTSCPYEPETVSVFYDGGSEDVIGGGGKVLSEASVSLYRPIITTEVERLTGVPESDDAIFVLKLRNDSPVGQDLEHFLFIENGSLGLLTSNVDAQGVSVYLPYNEVVEFPVILKKSSSIDIYTFENIEVYLGDPCDGIRDILQTKGTETEDNSYPYIAKINLNVEFKKSCSKVSVAAPQENWVFNRSEAFSYDVQGNVTNNVLPITFTDFNTDFAGFRKIELQYRNANASSWTKFKTYYGSQQLKDNASDTEGIVINSESEFTFNWDIVEAKVADGNYEIRAVAYCTDNVVYESEVVQGTINLTPPVVFGTPQPSDGILNIGEDIKVRFNEPIQESTFTNIIVRGLRNQQAIDHSVSVALDGSNNQIELPKQDLQSKDFTIQFWMYNATTGSGTLLSQQDGPTATLNGNQLTFTLAGSSVTADIDGSQYNFYSLAYSSGNNPYLEILENGKVLKTQDLDNELSFANSNSIFIGGLGIEGNIHDVRIWSKATTPGQAAEEKDFTLTGKEPKLVGYWQLNEGHGVVGLEKVRRRNAKVDLSWTIKPKGEGYEFDNNSYLTLDNIGFVQPTNYEDITMSFWVKANSGDTGTIFGNGTGYENPGEPTLTNGFRNKWDVHLNAIGKLNLRTEGENYELTTSSITDGNWHHVALVVRRSGSLNSYIDGEQHLSTSSQNIGGIAGSKLYVGARYKRYIPVDNNGAVTGNVTETIENHFTGKLDEFRLWNTARSFEQLKRDRYFELDRETPGLMLYVNFNKDEVDEVTVKGPRYNVRKGDGTTTSFLSLLNGATRKFIADSPSIKSALPYINIPYTTVINGDEMIISPTLTAEEWSLFEGQIMDISVAGMYDTHFNKQLSPVSFSAYVNRQEVEWFTDAGTKEIVTEKVVNEPYSFAMDVVNKGGNNQDFTVSGLPVWMQVSASSGTIGANSMKQLTFTIDKELAMGSYTADIYLQLENGYSDRLLFDLRVLQPAPDWSVNPADFSYSMNAIGQVRLDNLVSRDTYTKVGAFINGEPKGEAYLKYDAGYDSYFVFLTIYGNTEENNQPITFKVWDALNGKTRIASVNGAQSTNFIQNEVLGDYTNPTVFSAEDYLEQNVTLNKGWTWVSFYVKDDRFASIDNLFDGLELSDGDIIKSDAKFARYENGFWSGSLTNINNDKGYKIQLDKANTLRLIGNEVKEDNINISINQGWNWLSFPIHRNVSIADALAYYTPKSGDILKDQFNFAIFDSNANEWKGTLRYLQSNRGYMLKSGTAQTLNYPDTNYASKGGNNGGQEHTQEMIDNFASYKHNMSVIAEVVTQKSYNQVRVYDKVGVLRGVSEITEIDGKQYSFISVFSDVEEELNYVLVNTTEQFEVSESVIFTPNKLEGSLEAPIQLGKNALSNNALVLEGLTLYPNPFSNSLHIDIANTKITKVSLYNAQGKLVKELSITDRVTTIPTKNLASGMYVLRLQDDKGKQAIRKVIKK